jgi:hypothetical protein
MSKRVDLDDDNRQEQRSRSSALVFAGIAAETEISDAELEALELLLGTELHQFLQ